MGWQTAWSIAWIAASFVAVSCGRAADTPASSPPTRPKFTVVEQPAAVAVLGHGPLIAVPAAELFLDGVPEVAVDAVAIVPQPSPRVDYRSGLLEVEVRQSGLLLLAARWSVDGNSNEGWKEQVLSRSQLEEQGWLLVSRVQAWLCQGRPLAEEHLVFVRECRRGERFALRTRKFHPPYLLVPGPSLADAAWVEVGPDNRLGEIQQRESLRQKARRLVAERRYADLERWATGLLEPDALFPSGWYQFREVYYPFSYYRGRETPQQMDDYLARLRGWLEAFPESAAARIALANTCIHAARRLQAQTRDADKHAQRIEDLQAEAWDLLYDARDAGAKHPTIAMTLVSLALAEREDPEVIEAELEAALDSGVWVGPVLATAFAELGLLDPRGERYTRQELAERQFRMLERAVERTRAATGEALYVAPLVYADYTSAAYPFDAQGFEWPRAKQGFLDLQRRFPESARIDQGFFRFACANGDREAATALLPRLGTIDQQEERIWYYVTELEAHRAWIRPDLATGDQRLVIEHPKNDLAGAAWLEDHQTAVFVDGHPAIYRADMTTGEVQLVERCSSEHPMKMQLHENRELLLIGSFFKRLIVFDLARGQGVYYPLQRDNQYPVCFSPRGDRIASVTSDGVISIYEFDRDHQQGRRPWPIAELTTGAPRQTVLVRFLNDAKELLTVTEKGWVEIRDAETGQSRHRWQAHTGATGAAALSHDGTLLATASIDGTVRLWDVPTGEPHGTLPGVKKWANSATISPDGRWLAVGLGNLNKIEPASIELFDLKSQELVASLQGHKGPILSVDFTRDGKSLLSAGADMTLRVWNVPPAAAP